MTRKKKIIITAAVLMGIIPICFCVSILIFGSTTESGEANNTEVAVIEPTNSEDIEDPTEIPTPSNTSTQTEVSSPTRTTTPTNIPTSTSTSTSTPAPDPRIEEYDSWVVEIAAQLGAAFERISGQFSQAGENPFLLWNNEWITDTAIQLAIVKIVSDEVLEYDLDTVPQVFEASHQYIRLGAQEYMLFVDMAANGIDEKSTDMLEQSIEYMEQGTEYMVMAGEMMEAAYP